MNQAPEFPPQQQAVPEQQFHMEDATAAAMSAIEHGMGDQAFAQYGPAPQEAGMNVPGAQVAQEAHAQQEEAQFAGFNPFLIGLFMRAEAGSDFQRQISNLMIGESVMRSTISAYQQHEQLLEHQRNQDLIQRSKKKEDDRELASV